MRRFDAARRVRIIGPEVEMAHGLLSATIVILALADGALHLALDLVLFGGRFFQNQLSVLFLLNAIGYVVLAAIFWFSPRWLGERRWLADLVLIGYAVATFVAWLARGGPNPRGLGYPSKVIEVALVLALLAHLRALWRRDGATSSDQGA